MNKIHVIGRQTADPTQSTVSGVTCTNFSVAADTRVKGKDGNNITNFYRCTAWRGQGDNCAKYLHKGDRVGLVGDLVLQTYMDTKGQERSAMQVTISDIEFLSEKRTASTEPKQSQASQAQSRATVAPVEEDEDSLPF